MQELPWHISQMLRFDTLGSKSQRTRLTTSEGRGTDTLHSRFRRAHIELLTSSRVAFSSLLSKQFPPMATYIVRDAK